MSLATTKAAGQLFDATAAGFHPENTPTKRDNGKAPVVKHIPEEPRDPMAEWKEKMEAAKDEDIRAESSKVAFAEIVNQTLKEDDQDLREKKAAAKEAGRQYADATKANKEKLNYCRALLQARGKEPSAFDMGLQSAT